MPRSTSRRAVGSGSVAQRSVALRMARNARLVAIGFLRTYSRLPASMQQKYCDHGRSTTVLTITWPICRARSSRDSGGLPTNTSTFPLTKSSTGADFGATTQSRAFDDDGHEVPSPMGPEPMGGLFGEAERIMVIAGDGRTTLLPDAPKRAFVAYSGL